MATKRSEQSCKTSMTTTDPYESAQAAGLRYTSDTQAGIRRQRHGNGFRYIDVDGMSIRDARVLHRIKILAIPPAWTEVWICPHPHGHLQATGRDIKGRKQYRYHPHWRAVRDATKYDRLIAFGETLSQLRAHLDQDLARPGLCREKVLATVVKLLDTTLIRIGNVEYARENHSFGLTTMRDKHVQIAGATIQFQFRGKSGKSHTIRITNRRLATIVKRCQDLPGYELFQYLDPAGQRQTIDSADVNAYLQEVTGQDFTAKEMRTWAGTVLAACALYEQGTSASQAQAKKNIMQAIDTVAKHLGNTRAICRQCYIHPAVVNAYLDHSLFTMFPPSTVLENNTMRAGLHPEEAVVLAVLKHCQARQEAFAK
jgi:DNA topoisomerase I